MLLNWGNLTAEEQREQNAKVMEKFRPWSRLQEKSDLLVIARHVRDSLIEIFTKEYDKREHILPPRPPTRETLDPPPEPDTCQYSALLRNEWARNEVFAVWRTLKITRPRSVTLAINKLVDQIILKFCAVKHATRRMANTEAHLRRRRLKADRLNKAAKVLGEQLSVTAATNLKFHRRGDRLTVPALDLLEECWRLAMSGGRPEDSMYTVEARTRAGRMASIACDILGVFGDWRRKRIVAPSEPIGLSLDTIIRSSTGKTVRGKKREEYRVMAELLCGLNLLRSEGRTRSRRLHLGDGPHQKLARTPSERRDTMDFGATKSLTENSIFKKLIRLMS